MGINICTDVMSNAFLDESLKSYMWCGMNIRECLFSDLVCKFIIINFFLQ